MPEIKNPPKNNSSDSLVHKEDDKVEQSFGIIEKMTLPEVDRLVNKIEVRFKVVGAVSIPQGTVPGNEKTEEKGGNVSVKVIKIEATGLEMIKAYRAIMDLINELGEEKVTIVQAKKKTEEGDKIILTSIPSKKAEEIKKQLAEKKVEVEIK